MTYEIWTKEFGVVSTHPNYTDGVYALKVYAAEAGVNVEITFTGGSFRDDEGRRYVLRKVNS